MLKLLLTSFALLYLLQNVGTDRILAVIPTASYSHQMFYHQFWRELAIRGHEIVVITTDPTNETLPNLKEISIKETYVQAAKYSNEIVNTSLIQLFITNRIVDIMVDTLEFSLRLPQVQELINNKNEHFDLVMVEHFIGPTLGFKHRFNCPLIGVVSFDALDQSHAVMGNAVHSILYMGAMLNFDVSSSVFMRLLTVLINAVIHISPYRNMDKMNRITRDLFGKDTPPVMELVEQTDMLFTNANPLFVAVRPHTPSTINTAGGMHIKPAKPLPNDIKTFLDSAKEGAIYFSLGSNVKSNELTIELRQTIMETLSQLPYKVLWKYEDETLAGKPKNVHITKWAPQQDVLRHKNVKLFITQGGLQSLEETLYLHVPVVVLPFIADQESNAAKTEKKGLGLAVDKNNLTVEKFKSTILEVMNNPIYRNKVKEFALQIQDTPMTALERAVWWTEYVLRHKGAQHLKGPIIPWYQYYYLDVLSVIGSVCLIILGITFLMVRLCIRKVFGFANSSKNKSQKEQKLKKM